MSIIIHGMDMPTSPILFCIHPDGKVFADLEGGWREYNAIPVPPHGRLIDADALMRDIQEHDYLVTNCFNTRDKGMFTLGIRYAIMEASPTILDSDNNVHCKEEVKE